MPLQGLKVIELAGLAPGPLCGKFLRDFGATVILVNKFQSELPILEGVANEGKKSIALNLKSKSGIQILRKLTKNSDVLIDPFRKGIMEKLEVGPNILLEDNPRLIYARLSGYGQEGYYSSRAGHDINYLSLTGILALYGWRNKNPIPPVNFSEFAGGSLMCFTGILLALIDRYRTGKGQVVDSNITEGIAYTASWLMQAQSTLFPNPRAQNWLDGGAHFYDTYETKDGKFMAVGAIEPRFYQILLSKLDFSSDDVPHFENYEENRLILQKKFKEKTQKEWTEVFDSSDACVTPVLTIAEAAEHQHNVDRKSFIKYSDGTITAARHPRLSAHPQPDAEVAVPSQGEHTVEILSDLGYSHDEINDLCESEVVRADHKYKL